VGFRGRLQVGPAQLEAFAGSRGPVHIVPAAVLRPADADDVARAVAWAVDSGLPLIPRGAGTGMPGGNVGRGAVVDLAALDDVAEPDPETGLIEAGAGAVADVVDRRARAVGRRLVALPSSSRWCTVGGMVACDAAGARSFRFGPIHSRVAELQVVRADGTLAWLGDADPVWTDLRRALAERLGPEPPPWPAVRKNASGYALDRFLGGGAPAQLLCGSEGTLGLVTRVRLRTDPLPSGRAAVLLGLPETGALGDVAAAAAVVEASACEYFGRRLLDLAGAAADPWLTGLDARAGLVLVEVEGGADEAVDALGPLRDLGSTLGGARTAAAAADVAALWDIRHAASPSIARAAASGVRSMQFMEDGVVPVTALPSYLEGMDRILARHRTEGVIFGHAGDGNLHVNPLVDLGRADWRARVRSMLEDAVTLVVELGGTLSGEHGDGRVRAPYLERVWGRRWAEAFRAVKDALDPRGLLNPGVVLPLPGQDPLDGLACGPDLQTVTTLESGR
jgi:FAD/FMN-containing dehydrogenase